MDLNDLKLFAKFYIESDEILTDKEKSNLQEFVKNSEQNDILYLLLTGQKPGEDLLVVKESSVASTIELIRGGLALKDLIRLGAKAGVMAAFTKRHIKRAEEGGDEEKPWGHATIALGGIALSALATAVALKASRKRMEQVLKKCENEKGMAKTVCYNKTKRDSLRLEITILNSMKVKCKGSKNPDTCIKNIDKRIKSIQDRMDSIKVF
jgi:hypothetical protein